MSSRACATRGTPPGRSCTGRTNTSPPCRTALGRPSEQRLVLSIFSAAPSNWPASDSLRGAHAVQEVAALPHRRGCAQVDDDTVFLQRL